MFWPTFSVVAQSVAALAAAGLSFVMTCILLKQVFNIDVFDFLRAWIDAERERFLDLAQIRHMWRVGA